MTELVDTVSVADAPPQSAVHIVFTGRVQGVGFRFTTVLLARDHPIGGWVRNLSDGGVGLYVEGPTAAVEQFLESVRRRWRGNIRSEQIEHRKPTGTWLNFEVTR